MNAPVPVFPVRSCPVGVRGGRLCLVRIPALGCSSRRRPTSPARGAQTLSGAERAVVEAHCFRPHLPLHEATESGSRSTNVVRHRESTNRSPLFPPPSSSSRDHRVQLEEHKRCTAPKLKHFGSRHRYGCRKAVRGGAKA
ncbi:hypothetical protein BHE74_00003484 [Ensete ventricosum]|nr:hypothetical protein GW17_00023003 [Ensete ventricosum]RWW87669.1 hypothetical protein BHE74_00003484 [Ensete ventricosum]RZR82224.1 hypothetical protein BHM03_00008605 [Ensete ventricosum]